MENQLHSFQKVCNLISTFLYHLRNFHTKRRLQKGQLSISEKKYYQEGKKAETQERNLWKALELYVKAIKSRQKKDSAIKDFASSLHQLGFTKQAITFMDDCQPYYDGNLQKYLRLRDNLAIQINPTGKHFCKFLLLQNIPTELQNKNQSEIKEYLFKNPKRIKEMKFYQDLEFKWAKNPISQINYCIFQFQSFSAAKKTLQSFKSDEWFGVNFYWVNFQNMQIVCAAHDGKNDFQSGILIDDHSLYKGYRRFQGSLWMDFGLNIYRSRQSNGFKNLLALHILQDYSKPSIQKSLNDKQNLIQYKANDKFLPEIQHNNSNFRDRKPLSQQ